MRPTDLELLHRARKGHDDAFHELVDRHADLLYGLACGLVSGRSDAEDIVQETLLGAYRGMDGFKGRSSVKTWLVGILRRQAARHYRRGRLRRTASIVEEPAAEGRGPEAGVDVRDALAQLTPERREVIVLREFQGMSYAEMADVLCVPLGTVESRLYRARRDLRELLSAYLP